MARKPSTAAAGPVEGMVLSRWLANWNLDGQMVRKPSPTAAGSVGGVD